MSGPAHHLALAGARVIETEALLLTERAVGDLVAARAMAVLHGPAGSGKTFAAASAAARHDVECCWVQFPSRPTMLHVAKRLLKALTGDEPRRANRFELSDELIDLLSDRGWLIVVDEAQWLNRECIEYLRHLHDQPQTLFALLLVGGDGCWEVLSREPMLRSRIYRRVRFAPMSPQAVLEVIPRYHPIYQEATGELLLEIDERYAHGSFREWAAFTHSAQTICEEQAAPRLTDAVARTVLDLHGAGALGGAA